MGGGNSVVADTWKLTFTESIPEGWTGSTNTYSPYAAQYSLANDIFEPSSINQSPTLTSNTAVSLSETQRIIVKAKTDGNSSAYVSLKKSSTSSFSSSSPTKFEAKKIDFVPTGYTTLVFDNLSTGDYYLQFQISHAAIESIELVDSYDFCFDEDNPMYAVSGYKTCQLKYTAKQGWNTIILPFGWSEYKTNLFGEGMSFYALKSYSDNILTFSIPNYSIISANTPYIVYAPNATGTQSNITVNNKYVSLASHATTPEGSSVTFQGTYAPIAKGNMPSGSYGITNAGQIVNAGPYSSIKGYRAYLTGLPSGASARIMILDDDSNTPTDIGLFKMAVPEAKDVYTLSGQRVQKARKGIYVINGKKIIIK